MTMREKIKQELVVLVRFFGIDDLSGLGHKAVDRHANKIISLFIQTLEGLKGEEKVWNPNDSGLELPVLERKYACDINAYNQATKEHNSRIEKVIEELKG